MPEAANLKITLGPETGRTISVPAKGARLGRSSKNDFVLSDAMLSRHHCRMFYKDGTLRIADLGSANATLVNGQPAQDTELHVGDTILIGETTLEVLSPAPPPAGPDSPVLDLGLGAAANNAPARRPLGIRPLIILAVALVAVALAAWIPRVIRRAPPPPAPTPALRPEAEPDLEIFYEKVEATPQNIFRYELTLNAARVVAVRIDDIANDRHVRKEKTVDREYVHALRRAIEDTGFFTVDTEYQGFQPDILDDWDLTVTIGRRTHRSRVLNRVEPGLFRAAREIVEEFGKNELGLWAIQFSPETLHQMALDAFMLGTKLSEEREIEFGNLAGAIRSLDEAAWFLETVEPKPDFYPEILATAADCKELLQQKCNEHDFLAERAIRLREWETAAAELRILCALVPDRSDPRNVEARKKLLDVERRIDSTR